MGIFSSKVDVGAIETIETDVVHFIVRLKQEEGQLDSSIKKCLLRALQVYANKIQKEKEKRYVSSHKLLKIQELIGRATSKLNTFPSTDSNQPENIYIAGRQLQEIKNHLFEIDKCVKTNNFDESESDNVLRMVSSYFLHLVKSRIGLQANEMDDISILILKLYLKSSVTNISTILDKNLTSLKKIVGDFDTISSKNFNSANVKDIELKLKETISNTNKLTVESKKALEEVNKHLHFSQTQLGQDASTPWLSSFNKQKCNMLDLNLLKKVEEELKECDMVLKNVSPPIGESVITVLKRKIKNLIYVELDKIRFPTERVARQQRCLHEQGVQILQKLRNIDTQNKEISELLKFLKEVETKIVAILESDKNFCDKANSLELLKNKVSEINTFNNEVDLQKVEIINRLTGCIVMASANHLRQMKKTLNTHKIYAEEFPFSDDTDFFNNKVKELYSLEEHINNLPKTNTYINQRIGVVHQNLNEVQVTLEQKAKYNHYVIFYLKNLENDEVSVTNIGRAETSSLNKLNDLNKNRERINSLDNFHKRIMLKKVKICSKIQEIEEKIYETKFSKILKDIKLVLNDYEIKVETFVDVYDSDRYNTTKKEILDLLNSVHNNKDNTKLEYKQILVETINIVLANLTERSKANIENNMTKNKMEAVENNILTWITLEPNIKTVEFFQEQIKLFHSIELGKNLDKLSNYKANIKSRIVIEGAKLDFPYFEEQLQRLHKKIDISARPLKIELFEELLNELFFMKDVIDDMPEGDDELNSHKQRFSTEFYKILTTLDPDVGSAAKKQKHSENIVDLQSRFTKFNLDDLKVPRNSIEFVNIIRHKAESFEECAKYYMGWSYSVDYYVIHENLLRLLEELDRVECVGDDLLKETVDAMSYIKYLLEVLSSNVSPEVTS